MEGSQGNFKDSCLTVGKYIEESKVQKGLKMVNIFFFFFKGKASKKDTIQVKYSNHMCGIKREKGIL